MVPITSESCELSCSQVDINCRRYPNGRLDWYPFNPCAITTTVSTTTATTVTTTTPAALTEHALSSFDKQHPLEPTAQIPFFFSPGSLAAGDMLHDMESVVSTAEPTAQQKKQSYGLSWLVSEPELELILWIMFGVALLLMLIGFVGLGSFVCYRRRIRKQVKISTCTRYYDANRQRAYGIVAYDASTYSPALEYDKIRGSNGTCYWSPRPDSREPGTVRRISSPQISVCSPYCNSNRHATNGIDHNYVHHLPIPSASYRLAEGAPPMNSTYHIVPFSPPVDSIDGAVICKPTTCVQDVPFIQGMGSGTASLERQPPGVIALPPERQVSTGGSSLGGTSPIPLGNDTFLVSTYHRTNSFRNGSDGGTETHGQIIEQQTKV